MATDRAGKILVLRTLEVVEEKINVVLLTGLGFILTGNNSHQLCEWGILNTAKRKEIISDGIVSVKHREI